MPPQADSGRLRGEFLLERQSQSNWCWAAIGVGLARYFHAEERSQCALVQATRDPPGIDCCETPDHPDCNSIQKISAVLREIGVPRRSAPEQPQNTISFADIKADIANDRPVICLMSGAGGEHYVLVVGWYLSQGLPGVVLDDPADGLRHRISFSDLFSFGGRQWVQSTRLA